MIALYCISALYLLWLLFLAVMSLQRARDAGTLPQPAYYLGLPPLYIGLTLDCLVNLVIGTLIFCEIPQEWTVSARVSRLEKTDGWRSKVAHWICANLLNVFDPSGQHCK
jgi:hypothetical protein